MKRRAALLLLTSVLTLAAQGRADAQGRAGFGQGRFQRGGGFGAPAFPRLRGGSPAFGGAPGPGFGGRTFSPRAYGGFAREPEPRPAPAYEREPFSGGGDGPGGYRSRPYPEYGPPPGYGGSPYRFGGNWRQEQNEVRQAVREGRHIPLGQAIDAVRRRSPGRELDADLVPGADGRAVYRLRWAASDGRRVDYLVDAATGAIIGVEGGR